jgi:hypothetical protein
MITKLREDELINFAKQKIKIVNDSNKFIKKKLKKLEKTFLNIKS